MSAALGNGDVLLQAWADTMLTTALLVLAVLAIRKPFARHFGPGLAYTLWLVPALRLVLPPLPFADPVMMPADIPALAIPIDDPAAWTAAPVAPAPVGTIDTAVLMPWLFGVWAAGMVAVVALALAAHRRFRRAVLADATELEPIGAIRLVMTGAVDGPVAFGLVRRFVAVPRDFFARYVADERALAIDHELAHHRHGDLWANAAALLLLGAQWFNPFAWRAIRAFRFDQEAACDARVLTMGACGADADGRGVRTARYATAIAKAAVGPRLSLAAPMAVHDNLQERLILLTRQDISKRRGFAGRLIVGGATLAVLATTATLVPAGIARATAQPQEGTPPAAGLAPAAPPAAPQPSQAGDGVTIFTSTEVTTGDERAAGGGEARHDIRSVDVRRDDRAERKAPASAVVPAPAETAARRVAVHMPSSLSRDDILETLKEQGVSRSQAEAIADKLEAKRAERMKVALAPMPPVPLAPPLPAAAWGASASRMHMLRACKDGQQPVRIVNREDSGEGQRSRVVMMACSDGVQGSVARLSALKKVRENFATREATRTLSADIRSKVLGDLDRAIAEAEKAVAQAEK